MDQPQMPPQPTAQPPAPPVSSEQSAQSTADVDPAQKMTKERYLSKWSWSGFLIPFIWGFGNRLPLLGIVFFLMTFIPVINVLFLLVIGVYLGLKGRRVAWDKGKFKNFEEFRERNNTIDNLSFALFLIGIVFAFFR